MDNNRLIKCNELAGMIVLSISLLLQILVCQWQMFHSILMSALWTSPLTFFCFYAPKVAISIIVSSIILLCPNRVSKIVTGTVVSLLSGLWVLSELVYYRANHVILDAYTIRMIDNMDGFWGSTLLYIEPLDSILIVITIVLCLSLIIITKRKITKSKCSIRYFLIVFFIGLLLDSSNCLANWNRFNQKQEHDVAEDMRERGDEVLPPGAQGENLRLFLSPLSSEMVSVVYCGTERYIYDYSVLHAFFFCVKNLVVNKSTDARIFKVADVSDDFFNCSSTFNETPKTRLIICLVESFENWALTKEVMPNFYALSRNGNVLYCPNVHSQARRGTSADGQMIVETGLLPINGGAVCRLYQNNTFPSLSSLYGRENSAGLFPHSLKVWDQDKMSVAYGFGVSYSCEEDDAVLFDTALELMNRYESLLFITMSTHSPFTYAADKSNLQLPSDMPKFMSNYLKSFNYFDDCIASFISSIETDSIFSQSTIVFTGDHTVFQNEKREEFSNWCSSRPEYNYDVSNATCPLIIYSPLIRGNRRVDEDCYQMDIYSTLVKLLRCSSYCWNGFGVDLMDDYQLDNRRISEKEAFELSDNMIRSDFFRDFEAIVHPEQK